MFAIAVLLLKCEVCFCICQKSIYKIWHDLSGFCQACIVRLLIFISLNDLSSERRCLAKLFVGGLLLFSVVKDVNETPTNLNKDLCKISKQKIGRLYLKQIFGNCGNSIFLNKNYSKSSYICLFFQQRAELIAEKPIVGHGKIPGPLLNIICAVLWI